MIRCGLAHTGCCSGMQGINAKLRGMSREHMANTGRNGRATMPGRQWHLTSHNVYFATL